MMSCSFRRDPSSMCSGTSAQRTRIHHAATRIPHDRGVLPRRYKRSITVQIDGMLTAVNVRLECHACVKPDAGVACRASATWRCKSLQHTAPCWNTCTLLQDLDHWPTDSGGGYNSFFSIQHSSNVCSPSAGLPRPPAAPDYLRAAVVGDRYGRGLWTHRRAGRCPPSHHRRHPPSATTAAGHRRRHPPSA